MAVILVFKDIKINSYKGEYIVKLYDKKQSAKLRGNILGELSMDSFLIIDKNISKIYPYLKSYWSENFIFEIDATEPNKEINVCEKLLKKLVNNSFKKNMKLIAIGGGIIQDITSFTASILYRGVDWIFIPTTLLSQADSCIGSKTSINFNGVKNLLGSFHPPNEIYCFTDFLETLSVNDIKSGIGEILHYYIVDDNHKCKKMMNDYDDILEDTDLLKEHIYESLSIKKNMIEIDEFDRGKRKIFNYGHTFGHALEVMTNYELSHGQAVTLGMDIANFIAYKMEKISIERMIELRNILMKNIPYYAIKKQDIDGFIELLMKDKKNIKNKIVCILPKNNSGVELVEIEDVMFLKNAIIEYINFSHNK